MSEKLPIYGNKQTLNFPNVLYTQIVSSPFFKNILFKLNTYHEIINFAEDELKSLDPYHRNDHPSNLFFFIYKFHTLKLTIKQLEGLLKYKGCSLLRAVGFIFARFAINPSEIWDWLFEYIDDGEKVCENEGEKRFITIGELVRRLLIEQKYMDKIQMPRIPIPLQREKLKELEQNDRKKKNKGNNLKENQNRRERSDSRERNKNDSRNRNRSRSRNRSDSRNRRSDSRDKIRESERSRDKSRNRNRNDSRERNRNRSRDRSRERDRRSDSRERERGRDRNDSRDKNRNRNRSRERERSRGRRDSRERYYERRNKSRSKSRERSNGRSRNKRSRSRSDSRERSDKNKFIKQNQNFEREKIEENEKVERTDFHSSNQHNPPRPSSPKKKMSTQQIEEMKRKYMGGNASDNTTPLQNKSDTKAEYLLLGYNK